MAKTKQRLKSRKPPASEASSAAAFASSPPPASPPIGEPPAWAIWCRRLAAAVLGGQVVYAAYFPSDSVLVESGDALWFCALSLIVWTLTMSTEPYIRASRPAGTVKDPRSISALFGNGLTLDVLVWTLAAWMMIAALASCPPGNLRQATNEAWVWIAAAAVLTATRRLLANVSLRAALFSLCGAVATGMAVHALHQQWISLPQTRAEYLADPDATLRAAGVDAPAGSAQRMVFANRLLDGGPTATFALANSLAAVLLVAVLVPLTLLRSGGAANRSGANARSGWSGAFLVTLSVLGVAALFATRSRSALVACLLAGLWIWIRGGRSTDVKRVKLLAGAALLALSISGVVLVALLLWGDDEWMAAAPASLEFRLQYWKATARLLSDHPLLGAGPGGFQAMYLRYRLPIANESIADPHNFLFETLAAGGLVGGWLFALASIAWLMTCRRSATDAGTGGESTAGEASGTAPGDGVREDAPDAGETPVVARWMIGGACVSLGLVWSFALLSGQMPDMQASVFAMPVAVAAGWVTHRCLRSASTRQLRLLGSAILLAMLTHLTVSGGWTVPGVAMVIWLAIGSLCTVGGVTVGGVTVGDVGDVGDRGDATGATAPGDDSGEASPRQTTSALSTLKGRVKPDGSRRSATILAAGREPSGRSKPTVTSTRSADGKRRGTSSLVAWGIGAVLLLCIRFESIIPVQQSQLALLRAEDAARRGLVSRVESESRRAVQADDWGVEAPRWRSEFLRGRLVELGNDPATRTQWLASLETCLDRAGLNPMMIRAAGEQYLHLYQCFGQTADLESAQHLISLALANNPTDLSLVAQAAVIAHERSDLTEARVLADEARRLSALGGNVVRDLGLQQILVVEKIGPAARRRPVSASIKDRFRQRLGLSGEPDSPPNRNNETSQ
ncbi:O-Antigen ligase [Stieleria neptunia]|uniref:O-Antigen ligase n=1 Tax=Stieleria neptunia TaxID=2527979 RepID=A0A518HQ04_9BACT|nr:O-antigen ligase family protein [Stieleria neptunia]QDV42919.1 O-Antigen ligase [Stieleria neptunia]